MVGSINIATSGPGGGSYSSSYSTSPQSDFNSAPTSSNGVNMDGENLMVPSIARLLRNNTIPHDTELVDTNSSADSSTSLPVTTRTIVDPITSYICPVVSELQNSDDAHIANVSE